MFLKPLLHFTNENFTFQSLLGKKKEVWKLGSELQS